MENKQMKTDKNNYLTVSEFCKTYRCFTESAIRNYIKKNIGNFNADVVKKINTKILISVSEFWKWIEKLNSNCNSTEWKNELSFRKGYSHGLAVGLRCNKSPEEMEKMEKEVLNWLNDENFKEGYLEYNLPPGNISNIIPKDYCKFST
jgi:hypothetical protein